MGKLIISVLTAIVEYKRQRTYDDRLVILKYTG